MGQFLKVGMCYKFNVKKSDLEECKMDKDALVEFMSKEIDITCYNVYEKEEEYEFKIKDEIFTAKEIIGFLKEQYALFDMNKTEELFNNLSKLTSYDEILEYGENKSQENFQLMMNREEYSFSPWRSFLVKYYSILFIVEGKAYIECYGTLLRYIENLIKNKNEYKMSGTVKAFLD